MKNAMQLKAIIKNIAKNKNISTALVLQNYMLERFLERVSLSGILTRKYSVFPVQPRIIRNEGEQIVTRRNTE